ncbi:probable RNA-dependent RNA polymerase 5 isoform X2 [Actinidia eriantha]|uniref:probable RNA-dependent RNA polymerase 5 isoform X2 n=1 Tax=Actinidia eriantha TaxID=165200 RepID=UPI0025882518|nr:probable RNA-dependent RNA polymerase 5 isoform X2 [Actinidia eriantha]
MAYYSSEVSLPPSVDSMLRQICAAQCQSPPDASVRATLAKLGEESALDILKKISTQKIKKSLSGFILYLAKDYRTAATEESVYVSPQKQSYIPHRPANSPNVSSFSPIAKRVCSRFSSSERASPQNISPQLSVLSDLEFRKVFLILSYIGRKKLEDLMSVDDILSLKDLSMRNFETRVWNAIGQHNCKKEDQIKYLDWDSGKTHLYRCYVYQDGSYIFKGPYLGTTRTHLQRELGDDNILIVKFAVESMSITNRITGSTDKDSAFNRIAKEGILVGLRHYRFFVFKDGGKEEKKKNKYGGKEEKNSPTSSTVNCYFVRMESLAPCEVREPYILSNKTVYEARCLFMHVHMVSSMEKYMARFSLILSTTIKLQVDLASVDIQKIEDIPCRDENGCIVCNEDGEPLIHTDGTGYISEDLALKTPKDFSKAKFINDEKFEKFFNNANCEEKLELRTVSEARTREPPLLMQIRLFNKGYAYKGTLLYNKTLPKNTIRVRPSMMKVEMDQRLSNAQTFNSLEIVAISHKPRRASLSKNLIALLSYGGVPKNFFLDLLANAWEDAQSVYSNKRAALRVALNHGEIDDDFMAARMILSGVPLKEPYLQYRLSEFKKKEGKRLKAGKLPISESFYLMGTADPTGKLKSDEVCVILEDGQISKDVLVYRNPGLHFGDIHRLKAVHVEALKEIVGNAKYGIFFSINGPRSVGSEIANGDFDGDEYWVSSNPELLNYFKVSKPWTRMYSTPNASSIKPSELSEDELEHEVFQLLTRISFQGSNPMSVAADSWTAFMDRLLILRDDCPDEKERLKEAMYQLVDVYYDALDAPKSGKKVVVPDELRAEMYPHYMERPNQYHSTSVLGLIYDTVESFQAEDCSADVEIWKLPCFDVEIPASCLLLWSEKYSNYRFEMTEVLKSAGETKSDAANAVVKKYKQLLYGDAEFEESERRIEDMYNDALAIYHLAYDHAKANRNIKNCGFAWKVAGPALSKFYITRQSEKSVKPIFCSPSVLREVLN